MLRLARREAADRLAAGRMVSEFLGRYPRFLRPDSYMECRYKGVQLALGARAAPGPSAPGGMHPEGSSAGSPHRGLASGSGWRGPGRGRSSLRGPIALGRGLVLPSWKPDRRRSVPRWLAPPSENPPMSRLRRRRPVSPRDRPCRTDSGTARRNRPVPSIKVNGGAFKRLGCGNAARLKWGRCRGEHLNVERFRVRRAQ